MASTTALETDAKYNYIRDEQRAAGRPKSEVLPLLPFSKEPRLPPLPPPEMPVAPPPRDSATNTQPDRAGHRHAGSYSAKPPPPKP